LNLNDQFGLAQLFIELLSNVDAAAKSRAIRIADFATGAKLQPRIHMVSATGL